MSIITSPQKFPLDILYLFYHIFLCSQDIEEIEWHSLKDTFYQYKVVGEVKGSKIPITELLLDIVQKVLPRDFPDSRFN